MPKSIYLAYTTVDAEWIAASVDLNRNVVYSGLAPHLVFRKQGICGQDSVVFYRALDFSAIAEEAAGLHTRLIDTLRKVCPDYGLTSSYRGIDILDCFAHLLYYFFYEAVVSAHLAGAILRAYEPSAVYVDDRPLSPVTHFGIDPPRINYENQIWRVLRGGRVAIHNLRGVQDPETTPPQPSVESIPVRGGGLGRQLRQVVDESGIAMLDGARRLLATLPRRKKAQDADILLALHHPYWTSNYASIGPALAVSCRLFTLDILDDPNSAPNGEACARLWEGWRGAREIPGILLPQKNKRDVAISGSVGRLMSDRRLAAAFGDCSFDVLALLRPRVEFLFRIDVPRVCQWIDCGFRVFRELQPRLLVMPTEVAIQSRTLAKVARQCGIKTLVVSHGSPHSLDIQVTGRQRPDLFHWYQAWGETTPDYCVVWGDYAKRLLVKAYGWDGSRIAVTGWPWIDNRLQQVSGANDQPRQSLADRRRFLFLNTVTIKHQHYVYDALGRAAQHFNAQLVVRPHPSEDISGLRELAEMSGVGLRFDRETDLLELIRDADVVLGAATSVTSYAIALGKPCVFVSLLQFKDYLPYALEGAAIGVYEPDQLIPSIDRLLNDSAVRKHQQEMQSVFTKDYLGPLDGRAVRRIVDLVSELLKPRKTTQFR